jgi:sialate O-acetylesterase
MHLHTPFILIAAVALNAAWAAAPQFDRIYGSHMVLPHGKNVPVSGTADPNKEVSVTFGSSTLNTKADARGKWRVMLPPMQPNGTGQTLTATQNGDSSKLDDVLVGEVWLASGQSNMLFRLNQTNTAREDMAASGDEQLRLLNNVPQAHTNNAPYSDKDFASVTTDNFYKGQWQASGPMAAVGYYFGKKLREGLGMPVGIIHSSLGGSEIAAWIPRQVINTNNSFRTLRGNHWLDSPLISDWVRGRAKKNISPRLDQGSPTNRRSFMNPASRG